MAIDIIMPNLGFDAQENRLIEWLKQPGEPVQKGEAIAIIESDKANVELESIAAGVLLEQLCQADEVVSVGTIIARIGQVDELLQLRAEAAPQIPAKQPEVVASRPIEKNTPPSPVPATPLALPKVRKAAREAGIKLAAVSPSGPHGNITLADIQAYQHPSTAGAGSHSPMMGGQEIPLSKTRRMIGQRLSESKREAPHFYVTGEFDLEQAVQQLQAMPTPQPGFNDLIQYLTVQTLRQVPELNAVYAKGQLYWFQSINLAIAVAQDEGLITPVIPQAERYSLMELAALSQPLIKRAQTRRLLADDLQPGTFTISNLGVIRQVDQFTAVINPPQVAIVAVGAIKPRPIVLNGGLYVHHTVHLTLSGDHRVLDGLHLARFMAVFQEQITSFTNSTSQS